MAFSLRDRRCGGPVGLAGHTDGSLGTHAQDLSQLALSLSLCAQTTKSPVLERCV
jgi:hypothetical protein